MTQLAEVLTIGGKDLPILKHTTLIELATVDAKEAVFVTPEPQIEYDAAKFNADEEYRKQIQADYDYFASTKKEVVLTRKTWEELGRPSTITLTLEPGDKLNG